MIGIKVLLGGLTIVIGVGQLFPSFIQTGAIIMIIGYLLYLFNK